MKCPVCLADLRVEGTLTDYGYCPQCLKYRKLTGAIAEGQERTIMQRLAKLEAEVKKLKEKLDGSSI